MSTISNGLIFENVLYIIVVVNCTGHKYHISDNSRLSEYNHFLAVVLLLITGLQKSYKNRKQTSWGTGLLNVFILYTTEKLLRLIAKCLDKKFSPLFYAAKNNRAYLDL